MSVFIKIKKFFGAKLLILLLCVFPCDVSASGSIPNKGLIESSKAITGLQYLGTTGGDRVNFLIDYWIGFEHYQEVWVSPSMSCTDYNSWLRQIRGVLGDLQSLGLADSGLTVDNIISGNNQSFLGNGYPSEKWWDVINKVLRPGQDPIAWPGLGKGDQVGIYNPGIETPGDAEIGDIGNGDDIISKPGSDIGAVDDPNTGEDIPDTGDNRYYEPVEEPGNSYENTSNKNNLERQLKNITEMYAYSLLGEFVGHISIGLYEEFNENKESEQLLNNWNKYATVVTFKAIVDRERYKLYKKVISTKREMVNKILSYNVDKYIATLLTSFMNVYVISLQDLAEKENQNKMKVIEGMAPDIASSICQWVDNLNIKEANKKLKITRKKSLKILQKKIHEIMNNLAKKYTGNKHIRLSYKCNNQIVNEVVQNRINELVKVLNASKDYNKNPIILVSRISNVMFKSFKKVSIINGASIIAKFIVNPAEFLKGLKSDKDISSVTPKLGKVSLGQKIFHFGSIIGTSGAVGIVAGMTGQLWLMAIPTCANVIIDYIVSKTNGATMMKTFLSKVDESGVYTYEQQKILREFLKIASNKLNTLKNRIVSAGINKEVLGRMVTQLFNILEGESVIKIDNKTWDAVKFTRVSDSKWEKMNKYIPAKSLSSYSIVNAYIRALPEIYLAVKSEVNVSKNYKDKDANAYNQKSKIEYLREFIKIMTDMYQYMRYAGMMDLYYQQNYENKNKPIKKNLLSKIKTAFNKDKGENITRQDIRKFLQSLNDFVKNAGTNEAQISKEMKKNINDAYGVILMDAKQKSAEFGETILFKNLFNAFSTLYDTVKKNKYQKIMDIIPYIDVDRDMSAYTKETYEQIKNRETNLSIYLQREAKCRLMRQSTRPVSRTVKKLKVAVSK